MDLSSGGSLFNLEASLTLNTNDYTRSVSDAISDAQELSDALDDASGDIDVGVSVDGADSVHGVSDEIDGIKESADNSSEGVKGLQDWIVTGLAGMATITAIKTVKDKIADLAEGIAKSGDTIDKQSQALGISRKAYQEWDYILSQNGTSIESQGRVFRSLRKEIEALNEEGGEDSDFAKTLESVGLSVSDIAKMNPEDAFESIITALQGMDEGSEKSAAAAALLGERATDLNPLINGTADSVQELKEAAKDLGLIMSDDDVDAAVHYTDALDTFNRTVDGLKNSLSDSLLPVLTDTLSAMSGIVSMFNSNAGGQSLSDQIAKIGGSFVQSLADIDKTNINLTGIIDQLISLSEVEAMTPEQMQEWDTLLSQLGRISPELKEMFGDEAGVIKSSADEILRHKDALIEDMQARAYAKAMQSKMDAVSAESEQLALYQVDAMQAQNYAKTLAENQGENIMQVAGMLGEGFADAFELAVRANTDENGVINWLGVADLTDMLSGDVFRRYGLDATETAAAVKLVTDATTGLADAQEEADKKTQEYLDRKTNFDELVADTEQFGKTLWGIWHTTGNEIDSAFDQSSDSVSKNMYSISTTTGSWMEKTVNEVLADVATINGALGSIGRTTPQKSSVSGFATGLDYVPYNDFSARLHEGEAVLTKAEANAWRAGTKGSVSVKDVYDAAASAAAIVANAIGNINLDWNIDGVRFASAQAANTSRYQAKRNADITSSYGRGKR